MKFNTPKLIDRFLRTRDVEGPESTLSPLLFRSGLVPTEWFVDPQRGSDAANGRDPRTPKATLATLVGNGSSSLAKSGDTIYVVGNITEEITGYNLLEDITIVGASNRPRHADHARDQSPPTTDYGSYLGASWRQAASHGASTPLLRIRGQGWVVENILFAAPSDAAAIQFQRNADEHLVTEWDGSHSAIIDCRFAGGSVGIGGGEATDVLVKGCAFGGVTTALAIGETFGVSTMQDWVIEDNIFINNTSHIYMQMVRATIRRNIFGKFTTHSVDLTGGGVDGDYNMVGPHNHFYGDVRTDGGAYLKAGSNDSWAGNYAMTVNGSAVTTGSTNTLPTT